MKRIHLVSAFALASGLAIASVAAGCDGSSDTPHDTLPDSGSPKDSGRGTDGMSNNDSGGNDSGPPSCYMNPQTHYEIINACTDAQSYDKNPRLPLLQPDGSLPPLP